MRRLLIPILLAVGLVLAQPGWWGPGVDADLLQGQDTTFHWPYSIFAESAGIAAGSYLLQGKDTTALWNAKTLQGKDTTALYAAKTAIKIASDGDSAKVWTMTSPTTQGWLAAAGGGSSDSMWYHVDTLAEASGNVACDLADGGIKFLTMTTNDTLLNPTNIVNGRTVKLILMQDGDGSSLMTWGSHWRFCGDTATVGYATAAPSLTATALMGDIFEFLCLNDSMMYFQNFLPAVLP